MKTEEKRNNKRSCKSKYEGISLIVLVITIIVIIILATAIIVSIVKNNPIVEANRARYQSDRDNMQSIFTNTVAKIMAEKKVTIGIKACELNEAKSGVSSTVGETKYIIDNVESGRIIFDSENNTDTDYYTGKMLPIYSKETTWNVDNEGILVLQVGNEKYGEEGKSEGSSGGSTNLPVTPSGDGNVTMSQEEYNNLKAMFEEIKDLKLELKQVQNIISKNSECRSGNVEIGKILSAEHKFVNVTFKEPMENSNYSVAINGSNQVMQWAQTSYITINKTNNGFTIVAYNTGKVESGNLNVNYIATPYTE